MWRKVLRFRSRFIEWVLEGDGGILFRESREMFGILFRVISD